MELGTKLRSLRKDKHMSIEQLAEKAGLSIGLISQIERNLNSPTVSTLYKIAQALDTHIGYFFDDDKQGAVVRKDERRVIKLPKSNRTYEMLSPDMKRKMEFLLVRIQPGECDNTEQLSHQGEECGLVLSGRMMVKWGDMEYILEEGDSIYFDSSVPHRYFNIGDTECISVWAMTPPSF
ncbi:cupin domain-containing protein [Calorimonas adulescens]|uniref:Cupin domain-containing protein n=1 Tax=Calorimonas adulescens TaxID=2606906 RepID=A0A5D8QEM9_9THEO|nr:cupin domain-containing protein [Calorimonas adulescens]